MSINNIVKNALDDIAPMQASDFEPEDNSVEEYIVLNYFTLPDDFTDDEPGHETISAQVHYYCPSGFNSRIKRKNIKKRLQAAGFTYPSAVDASDRDGQHHIFECMIAVEVGGE